MRRYCRIIGADLLALMALQEGQAKAIADAGALQPLVNVLLLHHSPGVGLSHMAGHPVHLQSSHSSPAAQRFSFLLCAP
jgi:hypothetical protein